MRKFILSMLFILSFSISHVPTVYAVEHGPVDTESIINRANDLKDLLNHLLLDSNHSSIQKIIKEGDEPIKVLIADAFRLKTKGEKLLAEQKYMDAAVSLQSALDLVFKAIRTEDENIEPPDLQDARLAEQVKVNDTFIATAARVVNGGANKDADELLAMAKAARGRADNESGQGKKEAALLELEHSTRLAQQAIMMARNGMVIERRQ